MVNVVAVFQDFETSLTYFSYSNFGDFKIEEFIWNEKESLVFPDRMNDLKGSTLPVLFGGVEPAVIVPNYVNGVTRIGGYVGHLFHTFADKHNASLNSSNVNTTASEYDIHDLVLNGKVEMSGAGLILIHNSSEWYSYPYTLLDWGVMVPVEPSIPIYKVFAYVFHWKSFILTIVMFMLLSILLEIAAKFSASHHHFFVRNFFNIDWFRGILGQSYFKSPNASFTSKIIYLLNFLLGIMIVTSYDAFLQSFMTHPPREKIIKSFDDLQASGLKIYALQTDIDGLLGIGQLISRPVQPARSPASCPQLST
ncbi:uncharacterized protein LOC129918114 [Episyrphus balteatus]|uniref:uncharacterized protein LOC129918114 n=1 Tax=Episyrphus balteatus TaxID=286459 RepID=UPI00248584A2|nr:uncharacterized protein LOC129918114 [Episyrphus balteatus]